MWRHAVISFGVLGLVTASAFAQVQPVRGATTASPEKVTFEQSKQFTLKALLAREQVLTKEKTCVQNSATKEQLLACRDEARDGRTAFGETLKAEAAEHKKALKAP